MVAGQCVEIGPLIGMAVSHGGKFRVGMEDAPHGKAMGDLARGNPGRLASDVGSTRY